jgi:hypothetical protein
MVCPAPAASKVRKVAFDEGLEMTTGSGKRQKTKLIQVRVTPEEKLRLKERAGEFGVSVGELCRRSIMSSLPKSLVDQNAIRELALLRADLGRLGGLLKGWLAGSFARQPPAISTRDDVVRLRRQIEEAQRDVIKAAQRVSKPK